MTDQKPLTKAWSKQQDKRHNETMKNLREVDKFWKEYVNQDKYNEAILKEAA